MNIWHDIIDTIFDFSNRDQHTHHVTHDRHLYHNASKNPIFFGHVIFPGYRLLRIQLNVKHIVAMKHESAYSPFSNMLSYAGSRIHFKPCYCERNLKIIQIIGVQVKQNYKQMIYSSSRILFDFSAPKMKYKIKGVDVLGKQD